MFTKILSRRTLAVLTVTAGLASAHRLLALERVTLRNGFSYDCARQESLDGTHVRLYLDDAPASSYIDLTADAIVAVEHLPDLKPVTTTAAPAVGAASAPAADVHTLLRHAGETHNIDAELLGSIVKAESSGRAMAVSRAGARGLMQLMPGTAAAFGVADAFRPADNIAGGASYFDSLLTRYRDNLALALAAYNAGPAAVDRYHGVPPYRETRAYVARVMSEFKRRKLALEHTAQVAR